MSIYSKIDLKGADGEVYDGSVTNRFERDYENMAVVDTAGISDNRKGRQLDEQSIERQGRLYVDRETLVSATGQDAQLVTDGYGGTVVNQPSMERPVGAVQSYDEAATNSLVPPVGAFVDSDGDGVPDSEDYAPNDPNVTEEPVEPEEPTDPEAP